MPAQTEETAAPLSLDSLLIPKSLGKIEERFQGTGSRWVIEIQDVHAHLPAQENIAAILDHLNAVYGLNTAALEGGWSETSFPESWGLPNSREKQTLARALLEDGDITGPAFAALFSQSPFKLVGIEQEDLYQKNRAAYLEHHQASEAMQKKIGAAQKKLTQAKAALFNPELKSFDDALTAFREGKKAEVFLPMVVAEARKRSLSFDDLTQVKLFEKALEMEKALDKEKLKSEAERLMNSYKRKRLSFEELLKSGIIPEEQLQHYPASRSYLELLNLQLGISHKDFFAQLDDAIARVQNVLFAKDEERSLAEKWERFLVAKNILDLKATPDVLGYYEQDKNTIDAETAEAGLSGELKTALEYYSLAKARDERFFSAVTTDARLSGNIVMVAGGFHTEGITARLRKAGVSYVVITPELGGQAPDEALYDKRMSETVKSQTLSEVQNRFFPPSFDKGFTAGVAYLKTDRNVLKAVDMTMNYGGGAEAAPAAQVKQVAWADYEKMTPEEKKTALKGWLQKTRESAARTLLVITAADLDALLKEPPGETLWELAVRSERSSSVVLVYGSLADIPTDAIGGKFRVHRIEGKSVVEVSSGAEFKEKFRELLNQNLVAAIVPEGTEGIDDRILALPNSSPVSFLYRAFLSNPSLRELVRHPEFFQSVRSILGEAENLESFLAAA
ncbi:MAG TPA: hypothetical protein VL688_08020 [Verrucomicrobiae bacterium]|nr:hypothetical protein [Verrucomicrobiae bacterium]